MAKPAKAICDRCENRITAGDPFCGTCGCPTSWANHDERTAWEVAQYRHKSANAPIGVAYDRPKPTIVIDKPKLTKRMGLFSRRSHAPKLLMPEPKRVDPTIVLPPAEPVAAEEPAPSAQAPASAPAPILKSVPDAVTKTPARPAVARPKPSKTDEEPLRDTPATVLAMRMLNARVAELDARIRELQSEVEALRGDPRKRVGG